MDCIEETIEVEDSDENTPDEEPQEKRVQFYVQRMKFAVAVAIIRSTPSDSTPEKYASMLCRMFLEDVDAWRDKYEMLEEKMFTLEQKLQTIRLKEKMPHVDLNIPDDISKTHSSHPVRLSLKLQTKISNTIEFVRSFIFLGTVVQENNGAETDSDSNNLKATILQSLSLLFEHLRSDDGLMLEFGINKRAVAEVHRLIDAKVNFFESELVALVMEFIDKLLLDIYKTLEMNKVTYQHRRSTLIQMLAEHRKLTPLILCRLLREITILSDSFVAQFTADIEDFTPLLRIENAYYVLQAAEGTLHTMAQQNSCLNAIRIPEMLLKEWDHTTEKSLLEIGARFPMYSMYVWHIKSLMKSVLESEFGNECFGRKWGNSPSILE